MQAQGIPLALDTLRGHCLAAEQQLRRGLAKPLHAQAPGLLLVVHQVAAAFELLQAQRLLGERSGADSQRQGKGNP
ncbi:hypothetical protein D3C79_1053160 [compost metagenome]